VAGADGGQNKVWQLNLTTQARTLLNDFEPAPTDIVVAKNGDLYFTCQAAGVIVHEPVDKSALERNFWTGFNQPMGIAIDPAGENLFFTEVPTPGVSGADGGSNAIKKFNLATATVSLVHSGDPYPNSIVVLPNGNLYWTCTSAGVIIEAKAKAGN
jgi:DNA-binding beta-propeller fold protein YncE